MRSTINRPNMYRILGTVLFKWISINYKLQNKFWQTTESCYLSRQSCSVALAVFTNVNMEHLLDDWRRWMIQTKLCLTWPSEPGSSSSHSERATVLYFSFSHTNKCLPCQNDQYFATWIPLAISSQNIFLFCFVVCIIRLLTFPPCQSQQSCVIFVSVCHRVRMS